MSDDEDSDTDSEYKKFKLNKSNTKQQEIPAVTAVDLERCKSRKKHFSSMDIIYGY